jgi:hypothetical protein
MSQLQSLPGVPAYKDRSTGLMVFGVLQVLMGLAMAGGAMLLVVEMICLPTMSAQMSWQTLVPTLLLYALLAVAGVWLGIGSCLARRWAHALTLVIAWMALIVGLISIGGMVAMWGPLRQMLIAQKAPEGFLVIIAVSMFATFFVIYLLVPGIFVIFYRSKNVWATCQTLDPKTRWTDKVPLPVLALCLCLAYGAAWMPVLAFYNFAMPVFGKILSGLPGAAVCLALAVVNATLAWQLYKLRPAAWWATLVLMALGGGSAVVSFSRLDWIDLYKAMNFPPKQLETMRLMLPAMKVAMPWAMAAGFCVTLGFLLWIRRYFVPKHAG